MYLVTTPELTFVYDIHISLLLGGGYGFLTGEHGLALDNLAQVSCSTDTLY